MNEFIEVQFQDQERYKEALKLILEAVNTYKSVEEAIYNVREIAKGVLR